MIREGSKMECRKTLSSSPPMDTLNLHLCIEQFLLKKTRELIEQLLHIEEHIETGRKDGDMVSMETPPQCSDLQ